MATYTIPAQDVISYVLRQVGDESGVQFTEEDIIRWINAAQRDIIYTNKELNQVEVAVNLVQDQTRYPVISDIPSILRIHSIERDGNLVDNISLEDYQSKNVPQDLNYWWQYAGVINISPAPKEDQPEGLLIRYTKSPDRISDSAQLLGVPDSYFKAVVDYCLKEAYELDENFEASTMKNNQLNQFLMDRQLNSTIETGRDYPSIRDWNE